jgi:hypothetical protein
MSKRDNDAHSPAAPADTPPKRLTPGAATRILGSDVITAALRHAATPPGPEGGSSRRDTLKPFDPGRTRILDMKRLWPQVQVAATLPDPEPDPNRPPEAERPGLSTPAPRKMRFEAPEGWPKSLRAHFRNASPRRRALAILLPITFIIVLVRVATDPGATSTLTSTPTSTPTSTST